MNIICICRIVMLTVCHFHSCDEQDQLGEETGMRMKWFANCKRRKEKQNENVTNEFQTFYVTRRKKSSLNGDVLRH